MPGPPKTPTPLRVINGNPSKRPINKSEPKPPTGVPPTPKHFSKQEKYWFKRLGEELDCMGVITTLDGMGVITTLDGMALELLIGAYVEWRTHRDVLDEEGETYTTTTMTGDKLIKAHPRVGMMADAWKRLRGMMSEFGMTPAARSKVNANTPSEVDPLEEFLKARD